MDILIIYSALYSEHLVEIGLYFWIWFKGQVAVLLCCQLNWLWCFCGLGSNMTEVSTLLNRSKDYPWVLFEGYKNMERSILDEIGTFSCKNEEQITKLTGLRNGLLEKIDKVKEIDQKILYILLKEDSEKQLEDILVLEM